MVKQESNYDIGKTLLVLRLLKHYSQKYVADCLDMSRTTYHRCEQAGSNVPFFVIELAAELYRMSTDKLIHYDGKNSSIAANANEPESPPERSHDALIQKAQLNKIEAKMDKMSEQLNALVQVQKKKL